MFSGKKTYITAAVGGVLWMALQLGYINQEQFDNLLKGLGVLLAIFLREAITKSGPTS
jgi:hypothetical protein